MGKKNLLENVGDDFIVNLVENVTRFVFSKMDTSAIESKLIKIDEKQWSVIGELGYGFKFEINAGVQNESFNYDVFLYYYLRPEIEFRARVQDFGGTYLADFNFENATDNEIEDYIIETFTKDILAEIKTDKQTPIIKIMMNILIDFLKRIF